MGTIRTLLLLGVFTGSGVGLEDGVSGMNSDTVDVLKGILPEGLGVEVPGLNTMLCCTWHLNAQCAVWSALSTQCTVNLEHSNALSTQCTRSNWHSALSATHLLGTKVPVRALCVVPCARERRRPPWASFSLSLPLTLALPRLDLPVSVFSCDVRRYMPKPSGANQLIPVVMG